MTAFIVEGEAPGLTRGKPELKMGIRASNTTELYFENVVVPEANVLGERGKGFKVALEVLDYGRLSLGAGCAGGIKELMRLAIGHAKQRRQFGAPISDLEMIRGQDRRHGRGRVGLPTPWSTSPPPSWTAASPTSPSRAPAARPTAASGSGTRRTTPCRSWAASAT